jgi:hypothetical protein
MRKTDPTLLNGSKHWEISDIAFIEFCKYKGLKYKFIAELIDRSEGGTSQMGMKIGQFKKGTNNPNDPVMPKIKRALQLEYKIRSGELPDQKQYWLNRIGRKDNSTYSVPGVTAPTAVTPEVVEKILTAPEVPAVAVKEDVMELLRVSVSVNETNIRKLLKVFADAVGEAIK